MKAERAIHTTVNGGDKLVTTPNYCNLLNQKNTQDASNAMQSRTQPFPDDLGFSQTTAIPDCEESGRMFTRADTVIVKFEPQELIAHLSKDEKTMLIQRAIQQQNLVNRIMSFQCKNNNINTEVKF